MKNDRLHMTSRYGSPTRGVATSLDDNAGVLSGAEPPRVLVVDDNSANLAVFQAILTDSSFDLVCAQSGVEAMRHLLNSEFAAILLDMNMPTMDGLQTAQLIRERERSRDVPIIFISAYQPDQKQVLAGYASGAVDYLVKPVSPEILKSKVRIFVDLFRKTRQIEWQAKQLRGTNARLQREVTQREEAQRDAAFEREERQRVTLASIADAVLTTDGKGLLTSLNPAAESLTGWLSPEAKGHPLVEVLKIAGDGEEGSVDECLRGALSSGAVVQGKRSRSLQSPDGERFVDFSVSPVHDRVGQIVGAVLILRDMTARHQMEMERQRAFQLEQEARQAAEYASRSRDEFLAVISHELRTPLNAIVGWTHILRTNAAKQEYTSQAVDAIHRSAMAQKKLIEDLLDMSRIINGKISLQKQMIDLSSVIAAAVDTLRPNAEEKNVRVECDLNSIACEAMADRQRLQQVIWNVLSNAIKFTPDGGSVKVKLEQAGEQARISITDTGQGIAPEFLPHVFEAFRQADSTITRRQGGLGLGLAISRQLMGAHDGEITARSAGQNCGTIVTISLPAHARDHRRHDLVEAENHVGDRRGERNPAEQNLSGVRILVVDDDLNTLSLLGITLREKGAIVRPVSSAAEAMRILQEWMPQVVLSDISMPDEDGYTLIRRIRELPACSSRELAAFALTAMAGEDDKERAMNAGFDAHIAKPFDLDLLAKSINNLLSTKAAAGSI